jgi:hypothetical protein
MNVCFGSSQAWRKRRRISPPAELSRLPVGSSARTISGPVTQGAGDSHPLLLAARELVRPVLPARFLEGDPREAFQAALADCLTATDKAAAVNRSKGKFVQIAFSLFLAQLLILVFLLATVSPGP